MLAKGTMGRTALLALLAVTAQAGGPARHPRPVSTSSPAASATVTDEPQGLIFRLSAGAPETEHPTSTPTPATQPLDAITLAALLGRLPALEAPPQDRQDVALREASLPAPRTGRTLPMAFVPAPTATSAPEQATQPLQVLRVAPEGEVPLAPQLSLTFSQPMVPVTTLDQLAAEAVPVRLRPNVPGQWRWLGTRTLVFEPQGRFPMATSYAVEVPAGTRAASGATLDEARRFSFATPPLGLVASHPNAGPVRRDTLMAVAFDQRIDPATVLTALSVQAAGRRFALRAASPEECAADPAVQALLTAQPERAMAFRTREALPADSEVLVSVAAGARSAEGPRATTKAQSWRFRTYGPLRVVRQQCGWGQRGCVPGLAWGIEFSNPLDRRAFRKTQVTIEPTLPGLRLSVAGPHLTVEGRTRGRTRYTVSLAPDLRDEFGQSLGTVAPLTFDVGPAEASFMVPANPFVVLDPGRAARLPLYTTNEPAARLRAYAVTPDDWPAFHRFQRDPTRVPPPGRRVLDKLLPIAPRPDALVETALDLSAAFPAGLGHAVVVVEPSQQPKEEWRRQRYVGWLQSTRLGLSAFVDNNALVAWANDLATGQPAADVQIVLHPAGLTATTDAQGLARVALDERNSGLLVARRGTDVALLPETPWWYDEAGGGSWHQAWSRDHLVFHVLDDRGLYRPGEQARIKGWVRRIGRGPSGDVSNAPLKHVRYRLVDSRNNPVTEGECALNAWGAFDFTLALPATMNLGAASLTLESLDAVGVHTSPHVHPLQIQEFRRPEFEVRAETSAGPHVVGGHANLSVNAAYYAGGALPDAEVTWTVTARAASYAPPGHDEFTFGEWVPWWKEQVRPQHDERREQFSGRTDARGRHELRVDFAAVRPARPSSLRAEASVADVNRQAWTATTSLLVHPADVYVGLRSKRPFVELGQALEIDTLVVDIDGRAVAQRPLTVEAQRLEWQQSDDGEWREGIVERERCALVSDGAVQSCRLVPREGGRWRVQGEVRDAAGRANTSALEVWVAGGTQPSARGLEQDSVTLVPDQRTYGAGSTARLLVVAPFAPAEGLLTLRRSGLLRTQRFRMETATHTLNIPIEEGFTPNVHVQVDLNGAAPRNEGGSAARPTDLRPAFASGTLSLDVPARTRSLALHVRPREARLEPGGTTVLDIELRDSGNQPVSGGEVAVIVADEAVLALSNYTLADPLATFYATREPGVRDHHLRTSVLLGAPEPQVIATQAGGGGLETLALAADAALPAPPPAPQAMRMAKGARAAEAPAPEPIRTRVDWNALALFAASLPTDAHGRAQVEVKLPDSLTRYRVMAIAVEGARRFGKAETTLTARLPLMVRPSPPRFLNFGDRFELPVVVQNQTDAALDVDVAVRATNARLADAAGQRVRVPANERVELRFAAAAEQAGTARFQVAAAAGRAVDAAQFTLPVWTPATSEAFATYGTLDDGVVRQPLRAPEAVLPQFGGLEVTTSSTAVQALTDALLYLTSYPYECSEQLASKILAVAALRDVLTAFRAEGLPAPEALQAAVARDLERLRGLQNEDGGFAFWRRGDESWPYLGVHVAHALERARAKGFQVPEGMLERSHGYLNAIESKIPKWYSEEARRTLSAYALHVRQRLGDSDPARARRLLREAGVDGLSFEALGWLLPLLAKDPGAQAELALVRRHLANRVVETAGAAHFAVRYSDGDHVLLHSDRRADAVLLEALVTVEPRHDLIPKLVEGLLAQRKAGRWESTQENTFVLLALERYFDTYEKVTPDFVARLWLGERYAGEQPFRGRSAERRRLDVPMADLLSAASGATDLPLVLSKDGPGRLYYRIGLRYAPAELTLAAREAGFTVTRRYEGFERADDVRRDADGRWHVRAGARVRVVLSLVAPARRYHVALVDPLPAGLEAENPALATTGSLPPPSPDEVTVMGAPGLGRPGRPGPFWGFWSRPWFEHQNLRDERVEAFSSLVWEGVYTYAYVARATTPGTFVVPPTKAEEMYHPETFGRSSSDWLVVE